MPHIIQWQGPLPDREQQEACTRFLQWVAEFAGWEYEVFDGEFEGPILVFREEGRWQRAAGRSPVEVTRRNSYRRRARLFGIALYPRGKDEVAYGDELHGKISFVFDNSPGLPTHQRGRVVTFERWDERPKRLLRARSGTTAVMCAGGSWTVLSDLDRGLCWLLLWVQRRLLPDLVVTDSSGLFEDAVKLARDLEVGEGDPEAVMRDWCLSLLPSRQLLSRLANRHCPLRQRHLAEHRRDLQAVPLPPIEQFRALIPAAEEMELDYLSVEAITEGPPRGGLYRLGILSVGQLLGRNESELRGELTRPSKAEEVEWECFKISLHFLLSSPREALGSEAPQFYLSDQAARLDLRRTAVRRRQRRATRLFRDIEHILRNVAQALHGPAYILELGDLHKWRRFLQNDSWLRGRLVGIEACSPPITVHGAVALQARFVYQAEPSRVARPAVLTIQPPREPPSEHLDEIEKAIERILARDRPKPEWSSYWHVETLEDKTPKTIPGIPKEVRDGRGVPQAEPWVEGFGTYDWHWDGKEFSVWDLLDWYGPPVGGITIQIPGGQTTGTMICPGCGCRVTIIGRRWGFCPHCGSRMRGD